MAFELAYLKLGIHRSMARHSCQVTYYNISSPWCAVTHTMPTGKVCTIVCARPRARVGCSTPLRALYGTPYTSRVLCLSPIYVDSKHAYVRVISLICMCLSSKGEQNHPNIFTCANRMYSRCKMHPPPSPFPSSSLPSSSPSPSSSSSVSPPPSSTLCPSSSPPALPSLQEILPPSQTMSRCFRFLSSTTNTCNLTSSVEDIGLATK